MNNSIKNTTNGSCNITGDVLGNSFIRPPKITSFNPSLHNMDTVNNLHNNSVYFIAQEPFNLYVEHLWDNYFDYYGWRDDLKIHEWVPTIKDDTKPLYISSVAFPWGYGVYVRGWGNTNITGNGQKPVGGYNGKQWKFFIPGTDDTDFKGEIICGGNLKYLLTWQLDIEGMSFPTIVPQDGCFAWMFYNYSTDEGTNGQKLYPYKLISAPELPPINQVSVSSYCYQGTFCRCKDLKTPPGLPNGTNIASYKCMFEDSGITITPKFPTTTSQNCYEGMFSECTNLTFAHNLPANTIQQFAYAAMFNKCTNLTTPPAINANTVHRSGCAWMFSESGITKTPVIPHGQVTYADRCFEGMFNKCANLTSLPLIEATKFNDYCCCWMFMECDKIQRTTNYDQELYPRKWTITKTSNNVNGTDPLIEMFARYNTPAFNTPYYLHNTNYVTYF